MGYTITGSSKSHPFMLVIRSFFSFSFFFILIMNAMHFSFQISMVEAMMDAGDYHSEDSEGEGEGENSMKESERMAFYEVAEALNPSIAWRDLYPDPCLDPPQGSFCEQFEDNFYSLTALTFGPIYDNTPSCSYNAWIHPSISSLTRLRSLTFYRCFIGNTTSLPPDIAMLNETLRVLSLRGNAGLVGSIPPQFGSFLHLERFVANGNALQGLVPMELGGLQYLRQLDLSNNKLQGEVPSSIGKLKELVVLDLSRNRLSGEVSPRAFVGMDSLVKLDLSKNMLQGSIPFSIGSLGGSLKLLDLSYNQFVGQIPTSFSSLRHLEELNLGHNKGLGGHIPTQIWPHMEFLMSLDLSNSSYEGQIPSTFESLKNLRCLDVKKNKFIGDIPMGLERLPYLYLLHLNGNNLSGTLPFSLTFVEKLGPNLLLGDGNHGLCSPLRNRFHRSVKACPTTTSSSTNTRNPETLQLTSTSSSLLNDTSANSSSTRSNSSSFDSNHHPTITNNAKLLPITSPIIPIILLHLGLILEAANLF